MLVNYKENMQDITTDVCNIVDTTEINQFNVSF